MADVSPTFGNVADQAQADGSREVLALKAQVSDLQEQVPLPCLLQVLGGLWMANMKENYGNHEKTLQC